MCTGSENTFLDATLCNSVCIAMNIFIGVLITVLFNCMACRIPYHTLFIIKYSLPLLYNESETRMESAITARHVNILD